MTPRVTQRCGRGWESLSSRPGFSVPSRPLIAPAPALTYIHTTIIFFYIKMLPGIVQFGVENICTIFEGTKE